MTGLMRPRVRERSCTLYNKQRVVVESLRDDRSRAQVNIAQKILTGVMALIVFPFPTVIAAGKESRIQYVALSVALAVIYAGLFAIMTPRRK